MGGEELKWRMSKLSQNVETIANPYWEEIQSNLVGVVHGLLSGNRSRWTQRRDYCRDYTWAIPDPETLAFVFKWLGPQAIEMGAGTGYWASLLAAMGLDILAFDACPPDKIANYYHHPENDETGLWTVFYPVEVGDPTTLKDHPDRTLFLCWPPYDKPMGYECLQNYPGQRIVYIGEGDGGCTGDDEFFTLLERDWHPIAEHAGIQWDGIHDTVQVYERGASEGCEVVLSMSKQPERPRHFSLDYLLGVQRDFNAMLDSLVGKSEEK